MPIRTVPTGRGLDWITEGFALFKKNPLIWIVNLVIFVGLVSLLSLVPKIGGIAAMLLQPVLVGGLLLGCRDLERGGELRIEHLFDGFKQNTQPLLMVGLLSGVAYLLAMLVAALFVGGALGLSMLGGMPEPSAGLVLGEAMLGFLLSGLIGLSLSLPIAMATWFAPALVVLAKLSAWEAMQASFFACLRNMLPFLLYGIVLLVLAIIAAIPAGLGLLVLGPVVVASVYVGYQDIFEG